MLAGLKVLYLLLQMLDDFKNCNRFIMIRCRPTNSPTILSHRTGKRHEMSCAETTSVTCFGSHVISIVIGFVLLPRPMKIYIRNGLLWFRCWRSKDLLSDWEVYDFGPSWFIFDLWRITILKMEKQMSVLWTTWDLTKTSKSRTPVGSLRYVWPETWAMTQTQTKIVACLTKVRVSTTRGKSFFTFLSITFLFIRS